MTTQKDKAEKLTNEIKELLQTLRTEAGRKKQVEGWKIINLADDFEDKNISY
jgi:hypothetical protein